MLNSKESKEVKKNIEGDIANLEYIKLEQVINIAKSSQKDVSELLKIARDEHIDGHMRNYFEETVKFDNNTQQMLENETIQLNVEIKNSSDDIFQVACMDMSADVDVLDRTLKQYILSDYSNGISLTLCFNVENVDKFFLNLDKKLVFDGFQKLYNIHESYTNFIGRTTTTIKLSKTDIVLYLEMSYDKCEGMKSAYFEILKTANDIYKKYLKGIK